MTSKAVIGIEIGASHTVILGPSRVRKPLMLDLTGDEVAALAAWSKLQHHEPGCAIDLTGWPGWEAVVDRRFKRLLDGGDNQAMG